MTEGSDKATAGRVELWIEAARRGQREAIDQLCQHFESRLIRYVRSQLGPQARRWTSAEDIVSQALLETLRSLPSLPATVGPEDIQARLKRTAKSRIIDVINRNRFLGESALEPGALDKPAPHQTQGQVTRDDTRQWIERLVRKLPSTDSQVVRLCILEGRTHEEAAAEIGMSADAVRKRLQRVKTKLRERLSTNKE